ncbi:MAG: RNA methyltransferase [Ignavibacteria bacterium]|nr:RNA methyltransferase [Ignavibacteria bacterium]
MTKNQIKQILKLKQKKYRELYKKFIIEGSHLIEECLNSIRYRGLIEYIIMRKDFKKKHLITLIRNSGCKVELIDDKTFEKLSETENPEGIIGIINMPEGVSREEYKASLVICLDKINDPGNLGTILRTCWWFGVGNVVISKNSADIYNQKVLRASQGAIFNLSIITEVELEKYLEKLKKENYQIFLASLNTNNLLSNQNFLIDKKYAFVFGNEVKGISENILKNKNYYNIKIDSFTNCESLNVSVSVGIILAYYKINLNKNKHIYI